MRKATIIVYQDDPYNSVYDAIFGDLKNNPDVYFLIEKEYPQRGTYYFLPSRKLKRLTFGLSDCMYFHYYNLPKLVFELNKNYDHISVLIHNACLIKPRYPIELLWHIKKFASINLLYLDVHDNFPVCGYANYLFEKNVFDKVFTIDPADAARYDLVLCTTPFSPDLNIEQVEEKCQLYFCGSDAGRMYTLYRIWKETKNRGLKIQYDLSHSIKYIEFFEGDSQIHFIDHIPYSEVLKNVASSLCILDITINDQEALTIRPYEAVVYNKKLLTNNENIKLFKYYDSKYMQYFKRVEDIDWDWIENPIIVDYGYEGDFSPTILLDQLE